MANTLITPSVIAKEALFHLRNNCVMGNAVHRDYKREFVKIGSSVSVRKPVRFTVTDGATRSNQDVSESSIDITVDKRKHVSWSFSTQDLTLTIEEYSRRYIQPACIALADKIDRDVLDLYKGLYHSVGTPGTTPATFSVIGDAARKLDEEGAPQDQRCIVLNPAARWSLADGLRDLQVFSGHQRLIRRGELGDLGDMKILMSQNVTQHTTGTHATGSTPLVKGASQTGSSITTDGWANSTAVLKEGDVITLAGVNAVNYVNGQDTGQLRDFVVTSDVTSDGSGNATINISPSIVVSGNAGATVTASPADDAAITVKGSEATAYPQNLAFHMNALALVTVPLEMPESAGFKARSEMDGYSIRVVKDYDIDNDEEIIRLDVLYGVKAIYPELGSRIWG